MLTRRACLAAAAATPILAAAPSLAATDVEAARDAMRRATRFMTEKAAVNGGYVWSYLPDFSRRWGEMEAWPSMIWTQAPGTPEMGQIFLDAWRATGEAQFLNAAVAAAEALMRGQHSSGGWNYVIDFDGEDSLRRWYDTIGNNGWRLEEFQHYYGNATFDDHATVECGRFLLRLARETGLPHVRAAVDRTIAFVLNSQLPSGGWPQRWPRAGEFSNHGRPDYTGLITLNDEVMDENIDFLLLVQQQWARPDVEPAIRRAMACYRDLQQPAPTPGWALQYTADFRPAWGRTYEPAAVSPHVTAVAIERMLDFYRLTGDRSFLARLDEALDWLARVEAPASAHHEGRNHFRFVEPGTNRFIAVHRRGSNAQNGEYFVDYDMTGQRAEKHINLARIRRSVEEVVALSPEEAVRRSSLMGRGPSLLPDYVITRAQGGSDLNVTTSRPGMTPVTLLIEGLSSEGYWPVELRTTSHAYRGDGPAMPPPGFVDRGQVGDEWDTSPFTEASGPMGISAGVYINNMARLIAHVREARPA
ncbi:MULTISPECIES: pectate lyase [unclassified Brevundimonas]|uniref:pectate lyase n=1 Tax=unclassified Brevundimonas TaxID=2622653 RepID=UPI0025BA517D|nr:MULTISPECIES: pectate lyase [unclassified Brevundimonas]